MRALVTICLLLAFATAAVAADEVYRWVDENGVVHYSDQPHEGAEKVEITPPQTYDVEGALPATPTARDSSADDLPSPIEGYSSVRIVRPQHDEVAWNIGGEFTVQVATEPPLNVDAGHRIVIFLNGVAVEGTPVASTTIGLTGLYRGSYELSALVVGADDRYIMQSEPITFHVKQTSIKNPR